MSNHVHLVVVPEKASSLSEGLCDAHTVYALSTAFPPAGAVPDWAEWLHEPIMDQEQAYRTLRQQTHTGRPCGTRVFLDQLELLLARTLQPKSPGPKPGTKYRKRRQR
jgi:hypothetical protein